MSKLYAAAILIPAAIAFAGPFEAEPATADFAPIERADVAPPFCVVTDLARGRRWDLGWDGARAYELATGRLIRHVRLPGAMLSGARESGLPDMLLDRLGGLIVSSNAQPRLWRISPARFEVEVYELDLASDKDKDFGFHNLVLGANDATLYAMSSPGGSAWKIDLAAGRARRIEATSPTS
jgi:hypothetical protein